jgi:hypothetical protein
MAVAAAPHGARTFEDLPEWVRDLVVEAETRHAAPRGGSQ